MELCARMRFISVSERTVEGRFSSVSKGTIHRHVSPAYVSLMLRLRQMEKVLESHPQSIDAILRHYNAVRHRRDLPRLRGLERVPAIAAQSRIVELKIDSSTHTVFQLTNSSTYSSDLVEQFRSVPSAKKLNQKRKAATAKARPTRVGIPRKQPNTTCC